MRAAQFKSPARGLRREMAHMIELNDRVEQTGNNIHGNLRSRDHVTPALRELHWLPIAARVQYKLWPLVHSAVVGTAPDYVRDMLHSASERMSQSALRSATNNEMLAAALPLGERGTVFLSIYEQQGTLTPSKRNRRRFYFANFIEFLTEL